MSNVGGEDFDLLCDCEMSDTVLYSYVLVGDELEHISHWLAEYYGGRDSNFVLVADKCIIYPVPDSVVQNLRVYLFLLSALDRVASPLLCGFPRLVEVMRLDKLALRRVDPREVLLYRFRYRENGARRLAEELKKDYSGMILETDEYLRSAGAKLNLEKEFTESLISCQVIPYKSREKCLKGLARAVYSHWVAFTVLRKCGVSKVEVRMSGSNGYVEYRALGGFSGLRVQVRFCDDPPTISCQRDSGVDTMSGEPSVLIYSVDVRGEGVSADEIVQRVLSSRVTARKAFVTTSRLPEEARKMLVEEGITVVESCVSTEGCEPLVEILRRQALC